MDPNDSRDECIRLEMLLRQIQRQNPDLRERIEQEIERLRVERSLNRKPLSFRLPSSGR